MNNFNLFWFLCSQHQHPQLDTVEQTMVSFMPERIVAQGLDHLHAMPMPSKCVTTKSDRSTKYHLVSPDHSHHRQTGRWDIFYYYSYQLTVCLTETLFLTNLEIQTSTLNIYDVQEKLQRNLKKRNMLFHCKPHSEITHLCSWACTLHFFIFLTYILYLFCSQSW